MRWANQPCATEDSPIPDSRSRASSQHKPIRNPATVLRKRFALQFAEAVNVSEQLLELALTHSSWAQEESAEGEDRLPGHDNEQLEFVGDAVLGLLVSEALYREFPASDEGLLTRLRAFLVSQPQLAAASSAMRLGEMLRLGRSAEASGVRNRPAVLADAAEAVIAAVYLSAGLDAARAIVDRYVVAPQREQLRRQLATAAPHDALRDAKTRLQERVQASGLGRLRYADRAQSGPAHQLRFEVAVEIEPAGSDPGTGDAAHTLATAEGSSKKEAQQRAAELALDRWAEYADRRARQDAGGPAA